MTRPSLARRALAEGLAAFALVFAGCGAIISDAVYDGALGAVGVALVFGPVDVTSALVYEVILTAILMFVIMAVATDTRAVGAAAAIAIGGAVGLDALFGGPVTGASMNPARTLGPAIVSGELSDLWIYLVGPLVGACAGALAYELVRGEADRLRSSDA